MIYVDKLFHRPSKNPQAFNVGKKYNHMWCHLWADDAQELTNFAVMLGLKKEWFQQKGKFLHYDIVPSFRKKAIENGAIEVSLSKWLKTS